MPTLTELINQGTTCMRLPGWHTAYVRPRPEGPWADLYDYTNGIITGKPIPVLITQCDEDNRWEKAP